MTPAFAKANKGIMPKATYGDRRCSSFKSKEKSFSFFLCGITAANNTPEIVECIPDPCVKYHNKIPIKKYGANFLTLNLFNVSGS